MVLRVKPEKKEERERIATALLRATLGLAAAHGFSSLGLREVARAADIAPTSFYRHFSDMEALGLTLIDDLVGAFISDCVEQAKSSSAAGDRPLFALADAALAGASSDPELMRFILAERVGSIASFRSALRRKLALFEAGAASALSAELGSSAAPVAASLVQAVVALMLQACGDALEEGPEHRQAIRDRLRYQFRMLLDGASGH